MSSNLSRAILATRYAAHMAANLRASHGRLPDVVLRERLADAQAKA